MAEVPTELIAQLRSGEWWTSSRVRTFAIILLVLEIAIFSFLVAGTHGWIVPLDKPNTTDFVSFYAAGTLANAGAPALAYDQAAHLAAEEALVGQGIQYQFFNYPPVYQALFMPFARLPYLMSFVLFEVATLLLYLGVARRVLDDYGPTALLALIAFPAVWWNIGLGQNAFLTAALFGAATLFVDRRPVLAGICFGALCYKPHFALLVPLALAVGGHWRAFFAAAGSAAALMLGSLALLGWETWHAFLLTAGASHAVYESGRILFGGMVSPFGAVRLIGGSVALAYAVQAVFTVVAVAVVTVVWRRGGSLPVRNAVLASATLVAIPLALLYDLMLGTIAACWLLRGGQKTAMQGWEKTALAILYAALLDSRGLAEQFSLPVTTMAALGLFGLATHRAWRELGGVRLSPGQPAATPTR
jgi:alpha-1,2-mannosyltransferase